MDNLIYRVRSKVDRMIHSLKKGFFNLSLRFSKDKRPPSDPYISSDTFRHNADHVFDEVRIVDGRFSTVLPEVKRGDVIFVSSTYMKEFFEFVHPSIKNPYILITHDGIEPADESYIAKIDSKIIHWFAKNTVIKHPKITPLPIGLENLHQYSAGITSIFKKLERKNWLIRDKKTAILFKFNISTNPKKRQIAYDYLIKHPLAEQLKRKLSSNLYLKKLVNYKFVASPQGAGIQCHREWEAMYLGVVPIVEKSISAEYFRDLGLPMWVINDWHDLDGLTIDDLNKKFDEVMTKSDKSKLYIDYWLKEINNYRIK